MLLDVYTHVDEQEAKEAFSKISFMESTLRPTEPESEAIEPLRKVLEGLSPQAKAMVGPVLEGVIKMLERLGSIQQD